MLSKKITIINKLGLHARASMKMVDVANRFGSHIKITYQQKAADAKDILEVMALGARFNGELIIQTEGDDENAAMDAVVALIENRFGERG